ncbi:MAG: ABC transporter ATP-binding protein [Candidatus Sumerlaeaceae bacterium]|nr:ABC transporter ATP-binding protein [Candidatus Sumerlaeaceae bacterium]
MLTLTSVHKTYSRRNQKVAALDNVTLTVGSGEFVSVVGPSGSGKSTLLLVLGGMLTPESGEVEIGGESLYAMSPSNRARVRREKVGFVFQTFNLVPYLTALANVQVPLYLRGKEPAEQIARATELLEQVGLGDRLDHKPSELSVGQQQRVALARMMANDPQIILADEPTGNLDPATGDQILGFLETLNRAGKLVLMVTHDMRAASRAGRILKLKDGRVEELNVADDS